MNFSKLSIKLHSLSLGVIIEANRYRFATKVTLLIDERTREAKGDKKEYAKEG